VNKKQRKSGEQNVALRPLMPSRYSVDKRRELREFEHRIIGVSIVDKKNIDFMTHSIDKDFF